MFFPTNTSLGIFFQMTWFSASFTFCVSPSTPIHRSSNFVEAKSLWENISLISSDTADRILMLLIGLLPGDLIGLIFAPRIRNSREKLMALLSARAFRAIWWINATMDLRIAFGLILQSVHDMVCHSPFPCQSLSIAQQLSFRCLL